MSKRSFVLLFLGLRDFLKFFEVGRNTPRDTDSMSLGE